MFGDTNTIYGSNSLLPGLSWQHNNPEGNLDRGGQALEFVQQHQLGYGRHLRRQWPKVLYGRGYWEDLAVGPEAEHQEDQMTGECSANESLVDSNGHFCS